MKENNGICMSRIGMKTGISLVTCIKTKEVLLQTGFINSLRKDERRSDLSLSEKGKMLLSFLEELFATERKKESL